MLIYLSLSSVKPLTIVIGTQPNSFTRHFHITTPAQMLTNHRLFNKVDWERVDAGYYAVVDPVQPGQILYLTEQDYL
jgi:hypothetical protein